MMPHTFRYVLYHVDNFLPHQQVVNCPSVTTLTETQWRVREAEHRARFSPLVAQHRARRSRGEKHPVYDFLFEYYSFRPAHLERWSAGFGVHLLGATSFDKNWHVGVDGTYLDIGAFPAHRIASLCDTLSLLTATAARESQFGCFGLHEWAMVYRSEEVRHDVPLRLPPEQIAHIVEENGVRCSHFDAFRFFTPEARPLNMLQPTRESAIELEQPGCIHASMDLYKWAYKFWPWISSELVGESFLLAYAAREIDMCASPYDLREFGFDPILIETGHGRREYVRAQNDLSELARPIRAKLMAAYLNLSQALAVVPSKVTR